MGGKREERVLVTVEATIELACSGPGKMPPSPYGWRTLAGLGKCGSNPFGALQSTGVLSVIESRGQ